MLRCGFESRLPLFFGIFISFTMNKYKKLCEQLALGGHLNHELKIALTHYSFSDKSKDGSRYVFLGQTEFKGKTARILFEFVQGKGTQLQHYLGNLFKSKHLELLFSKYNLDNLIRYGEQFNWQSHKHIFTYAFLGFLSDYMNDEQLNSFIYQNFIKNTSHLLPSEQTNKKDYKSQVLFLCKLYYNNKPKLTIEQVGEIYTFRIQIRDEVLFKTESKSYKYGQRKIWKNALKFIIEKEEEKLLQNPEFLAREEQRKTQKEANEIQQKAEKLETYFENRAKRSQEIKEQKAIKKKEAQQRDLKRREAKTRAKERKELKAKQQRLKNIGLENISASKRRILEDRGILPKKK